MTKRMPINTQLARRQVPTTGDADDDDADGGGNQRCGPYTLDTGPTRETEGR